MIQGTSFSSATEAIKYNPEVREKFEASCIKLLKQVGTVLHRNKTVWWCTSGTCLGFVREMGMIPGDNDIDIGIDASTFTKECLLDLVKTFHNTDLGVTIASGLDSHNPYLANVNLLLKSFDEGGYAPFRNFKFVSKEVFQFSKDFKLHPSLDIFVFVPHDGYFYKTIHPTRVSKHPIDRLVPVTSVKTKYGVFPVPGKYVDYLSAAYGETWETPKVINMAESTDPHVYTCKFYRKEIGDVRYDFKNHVSNIFPASTYNKLELL